MNNFFERHGYDVHFIARHEYDKTEAFKEHVRDLITSRSKPFLTVVDLNDEGNDSECKSDCLCSVKKTFFFEGQQIIV